MVKVNGSTIIEVMVASILFITLFSSGLDIVTRVTASSPTAGWYIEAENSHRIILMECRAGFYPFGETLQEFGKGHVRVTMSPYREFKNLFDVKIVFELGGRQLEYRHIITNEISST